MICIYQVIPEASQQKSGPSDQFRTYSGPLLALRSGSGPSPEFRTLVVPLQNQQELGFLDLNHNSFYSISFEVIEICDNFAFEWEK